MRGFSCSVIEQAEWVKCHQIEQKTKLQKEEKSSERAGTRDSYTRRSRILPAVNMIR
jgi:hypothetical protein